MPEMFPGERPEHLMRKSPRASGRVTCGSCRHFDGVAWCRRWNFHTEGGSPICDRYRPVASGPAPSAAEALTDSGKTDKMVGP